MNGDILEVWDASDRAVDFSSRSILQALNDLNCDKIYLVGNHDFAMQELAEETVDKEQETAAVANGTYPWGPSPIKIFRDTYPDQPEKEAVATITIGDHHYLFLHGHRFSLLYRHAPWQLIAVLRDGAESFRLFSWALVYLWLGSLILAAVQPLLPMLPATVNYAVLGVLTVLVLPRIFVSIARPIWNEGQKMRGRGGGSRYNRAGALRGFNHWWNGFLKNRPTPKECIHIVYGHTHLIDTITRNELLSKKEKLGLKGFTKPEQDFVLVNQPSWVEDTQNGHQNYIHSVFVYGDAEGFEFFGWDWSDKGGKPFHIPRKVVEMRISGEPIDDMTAKWLEDLGWPLPLIEKWKKPLEIK